jgi:hypothetical protein
MEQPQEPTTTFSFETIDREVFTCLKLISTTVCFTEEVCPNEGDVIYSGTLSLRIPMTLKDINDITPATITFTTYKDIVEVSYTFNYN